MLAIFHYQTITAFGIFYFLLIARVSQSRPVLASSVEKPNQNLSLAMTGELIRRGNNRLHQSRDVLTAAYTLLRRSQEV